MSVLDSAKGAAQSAMDGLSGMSGLMGGGGLPGASSATGMMGGDASDQNASIGATNINFGSKSTLMGNMPWIIGGVVAVLYIVSRRKGGI